jgi:hypothetical protein
MDRQKLTDTISRSRQHIDRRERLGRVNSGARLGVLPSAANRNITDT